MRVYHTHPPGTTPEARVEDLRLIYQRCLRALYGDSRPPRRIAADQPTVR